MSESHKLTDNEFQTNRLVREEARRSVTNMLCASLFPCPDLSMRVGIQQVSTSTPAVPVERDKKQQQLEKDKACKVPAVLNSRSLCLSLSLSM